MKEKTYKTMEHAGVVGLITGIISVAVGLSCGALLIIHGARLLKEKKNVLI